MPLLLRLGKGGLVGIGMCISCSPIDESEEESDLSGRIGIGVSSITL